MAACACGDGPGGAGSTLASAPALAHSPARLRRRFNTTGPCVEGRHYLIDPLSRLPEAPGFIEQGAYFVVHAPRQTGKTTTILALARELTRRGEYAAVYSSCQIAADTEDVGQAIGALVYRLGADARQQLPPELHPPHPPKHRPSSR